jgi:hypothetical protein
MVRSLVCSCHTFSKHIDIPRVVKSESVIADHPQLFSNGMIPTKLIKLGKTMGVFLSGANHFKRYKPTSSDSLPSGATCWKRPRRWAAIGELPNETDSASASVKNRWCVTRAIECNANAWRYNGAQDGEGQSV